MKFDKKSTVTVIKRDEQPQYLLTQEGHFLRTSSKRYSFTSPRHALNNVGKLWYKNWHYNALLILFTIFLSACSSDSMTNSMDDTALTYSGESIVLQVKTDLTTPTTRASVGYNEKGNAIIDYASMVGKQITVHGALHRKGDAAGEYTTFFSFPARIEVNGSGSYTLSGELTPLQLKKGDFTPQDYYVQFIFTGDDSTPDAEGALSLGDNTLWQEADGTNHGAIHVPAATQWYAFSSKAKLDNGVWIMKQLEFNPMGTLMTFQCTDSTNNNYLKQFTLSSTGLEFAGKITLGAVSNVDNPEGEMPQYSSETTKLSLENLQLGQTAKVVVWAMPTETNKGNRQLNIDIDYVARNHDTSGVMKAKRRMIKEETTGEWFPVGLINLIPITITNERTATADADKAKENLYKWMDYIADDTPVWSMLLPGTHDTATDEFTWFSNIAKPWSQCQEGNLLDQFKVGVRVFDLRVDDDMWMKHGITATSHSLEDMLKQVNNCRKLGPSETIILQIKAEDCSADTQWKTNVNKLLRQYFGNDIVNDFTANTTLGEVRGKVIVLHREFYTAGVDPQPDGSFIDYEDNDVDLETAIYPYRSLYNGTGTQSAETVYLQDNYQNVKVTTKIQEVKDMLTKSIQRWNAEKALTINFASLAGNPGNNAKTINPALLEFFSQDNTPHYRGILFMDFVNRTSCNGPELTQAVVMNNFK